MIAVNIRELTHHFSQYLKKVKAGESITILERNIPVANIIPNNENVIQPGWKRKLKPIKIGGELISDTVVKNRE